MTEASLTTARSRDRIAALRSVGAGMVLGLISVVFSISFGAIIFSGPVGAFRESGIILILTGSIIYGVASLLFRSPIPAWWANQTAPVAMMAIGAGALAQSMPDAAAQTQFASVSLLMAVTTALTGLTFLALGATGLAQFAKFVPYPVIGGFLTATGIFLIHRAAMLPLGPEARVMDVFDPGSVPQWLPFVAVGALVSWSGRWVSAGSVLLVVVVAYVAASMAIEGLHVEGSDVWGMAGLPIGGTFDGTNELAALSPSRFDGADPGAVMAQWPVILSAVGLSILGLIMSSSAIEIVSAEAVNLNREMRRAGIANLAGGLLGTAVGHVSASMFSLSRHLAPGPSPLLPITAICVLGFVLVAGLRFVPSFPAGLFCIVLSFAGFQIVFRWIVKGAREMPLGDYAILLSIAASALLIGFAFAIMIGMIASVVRFALAYSRIDVVRSQQSGRLRLSPTERSARDTEVILARGRETAVYELQGFLFFGTSNALYDRIASDVERAGVPVRNLVVDFRRVEGFDVSTSFVFKRLLRFATSRGIRPVFAGLRDREMRQLRRTGAAEGAVFRRTLGEALREIEDDVLAEAQARDGTSRAELEDLFAAAEGVGVCLATGPEPVAKGGVVFEQGAASETLVYLVEGRLAARVVRPDGGEVTVAVFLPGAIAGEIGLFTGEARSARLVAEEDSLIRSVTSAALERVGREHPDFAARFNAIIATYLARRLGRTTALFVALDR